MRLTSRRGLDQLANVWVWLGRFAAFHTSFQLSFSLSTLPPMAAVNGPSTTRDKKKQTVDVYVQIAIETGDKKEPKIVQKLSRVPAKIKLSALKTRIEKDMGILKEMYTLSYLDSCPLEDNSTLKDHFFVSGSQLRLQPWDIWSDLLHHCYRGDVTQTLSTMDITGQTDWNIYCAWVALYIASHRGHHFLTAKLIKQTHSILVNHQSRCTGWTALHAAARAGHWRVLCILLDNGANVRIRDSKQLTAFDLAREYGHKKCENSLNFCQWNLQKHYIVEERRKDYDAHHARRRGYRQTHLQTDSTITPWVRGPRGQIYTASIPNTVSIRTVQDYDKMREGEGNRGGRERDERERGDEESVTLPSVLEGSQSEEPAAISNKEKFQFDYGWFDQHRARQLIPKTDDILIYSNPSANGLHPRSLLNPEGMATPLVSLPSPSHAVRPKR